MPINLTTGLPGSGKTLSTLVRVKELSEKQNRNVYYHGIKDLQLSWKLLDNPKQWFALPEGSIIVIDECQDLFPVHETKLASEIFVLELAKHRHRGYDLYFITQHPMNIHPFVRRLIDNHQHLIRAFGMATANIHQWNRVIDYPEKQKKDSQTQIFNYPKDAYKYYKSAEVHTIQRKIPKRLIWLLLIPPLMIALGYVAWTKLNPAHTRALITKQPEGLYDASKNNQLPQATHVNYDDLTYLQAHLPVISSLPFTAPVYKEIIKPTQAPYPAACILSHSQGCNCYTQQGTRLDTETNLCKQIVKNGFFIDWQKEPNQATNEPTPQSGVSGRSPDVDTQPFNLDKAPSRASPVNPSRS